MRISFIDRLSNLYILLLIVGFLFIGTIPKLVGMSESSLSIQYRIIILSLSFFLIINAFFNRRKRINLSKFHFFLFFWVIYTVRILYDMYIDPISLYPGKGVLEYIQFAFGVVLLPSICTLVIVQTSRLDYNWIVIWIYRVLLSVLVLALYFRVGLDVVGRTAGDINVGILLFGQFGATLSILSIYFLSRDPSTSERVFYIMGFIVGFVAIFVSASKSPFFALIVVILFFFVLRYSSFKAIILISTIGLVVGLYFLEIVSFLNQYFNSTFMDRLLYTIKMGGDEARENLLKAAYNEFTDQPLFGNAMLIQDRRFAGSYPHNLIVESFMATGLIGGGFFLMWIFRCIKSAILLMKANFDATWIALLFLQYFIFGMFSKNLFSNDMFWVFSIMLIGYKIKEERFI